MVVWEEIGAVYFEYEKDFDWILWESLKDFRVIHFKGKYLKGGHRINYEHTQNADQYSLLTWMVLSGKILPA